MGAYEYMLWAARDEVQAMIDAKQERHKGLTYGQALDMVRAEHRAHVARKGN